MERKKNKNKKANPRYALETARSLSFINFL